MNKNLLNELVSEAGVSYLSDLHDPRSFRKIFHALDRLSPDNYSLEEWEEAVTYILGLKRRPFPSPASPGVFCRQSLKKRLCRKKPNLRQQEIVTFKNSDFFKGV